MSIGFGQLVIILVLILILFGAGKLPKVMEDIGHGIRRLQKGLNAKDDPQEEKKNIN
jgi:sec-independent protein translocase protein TatA